MKEFVDSEEALSFLVKEGRITSETYWRNALTIVKNLDSLIIKWANDVQKIK